MTCFDQDGLLCDLLTCFDQDNLMYDLLTCFDQDDLLYALMTYFNQNDLLYDLLTCFDQDDLLCDLLTCFDQDDLMYDLLTCFDQDDLLYALMIYFNQDDLLYDLLTCFDQDDHLCDVSTVYSGICSRDTGADCPVGEVIRNCEHGLFYDVTIIGCGPQYDWVRYTMSWAVNDVTRPDEQGVIWLRLRGNTHTVSTLCKYIQTKNTPPSQIWRKLELKKIRKQLFFPRCTKRSLQEMNLWVYKYSLPPSLPTSLTHSLTLSLPHSLYVQ